MLVKITVAIANCLTKSMQSIDDRNLPFDGIVGILIDSIIMYECCDANAFESLPCL